MNCLTVFPFMGLWIFLQNRKKILMKNVNIQNYLYSIRWFRDFWTSGLKIHYHREIYREIVKISCKQKWLFTMVNVTKKMIFPCSLCLLSTLTVSVLWKPVNGSDEMKNSTPPGYDERLPEKKSVFLCIFRAHMYAGSEKCSLVFYLVTAHTRSPLSNNLARIFLQFAGGYGAMLFFFFFFLSAELYKGGKRWDRREACFLSGKRGAKRREKGWKEKQERGRVRQKGAGLTMDP